VEHVARISETYTKFVIEKTERKINLWDPGVDGGTILK
jgi:hypothetical protein